MKNKQNSFFLSLSAVPVQIASEFDCDFKQLLSNDCDIFFDYDGRQEVSSPQQIQIVFLYEEKNPRQIAGEKIYSHQLQQNAHLYAGEEGRFELHCFADQQNDIRWSLRIDPNFSCFKYSFSSHHAIDPIELHHLIFNRFLLQHTFINQHGLIIHAAGGSIHGKGMVFPAVSGTGKSTLSHLLLPFPENQLYSEERIVMRKMNDSWQLWGTPWKGTGVIARNESAPLSALVFLSQAPQTKIFELAPSAALRRLLETVSIPWYSQEWTDKGLAVCESLLRDIPAFELAFRPDQTAVQAVADLAASLP